MSPARLRAGIADARFWRTDEGLVVAVRVRNDEDRTLLVGSSVRQIGFDASTGELTVWFSDHGRDPGVGGGGCRVDTVPRTVPMEAGGEVEIRGRIPPRVRRLVGMGEKGPEIEEHRMEDVERVAVHVTVAEAPFYFNPKGGPAVRQLKAWGDDLEARARPGREPREAEGEA